MSEDIVLTGIILSGAPIGEYDRRLVILTKERGKISCFAKNARRPTNHLSGTTRTFSFGSFQVYEGRSAYNLHKAEIKNFFENIITNYDATLYACYFAEIADYYGKEGIGAKDAINLLYAALNALADVRLDNRLVKSVYEIRAVYDEGECPPYEDISDAKEKTCKNTMMAFSYIISAPVKDLFKFTVGDETINNLEKISGKIISFAIDKRLKSASMLP